MAPAGIAIGEREQRAQRGADRFFHRPVAWSIASMLVNFSRGLPSSAAATSASSLRRQSRKVTGTTLPLASSAPSPERTAFPAPRPISYSTIPPLRQPAALFVPILPPGPPP